MAGERLALQKGRTGMAILGKPLAEVASTLAEHLSDSIASGEAFAQASLTSELLVCLVTKVSRDDFHFYIGRGQFPKIVNKPIVPKNKKGYFCREDLEQWANCLSRLDYFLTLDTSDKKSQIGVEIGALLPKVIRLFPETLRLSHYQIFSLPYHGVSTFMELNIDQIKTIRNSTSIAFDLVLKDVMYQASQNWRTFVRQQLHKGGGILFKHISKEDKAYLNVDISKFGKDTCSPSVAIAEQTEFWSQYWAPPNESLIQEVANDMKILLLLLSNDLNDYNKKKCSGIFHRQCML